MLTCERCGAFACPECVDDQTALCATCVEAGHAGVPVPWEAPGGGGFWATMRAVWLTPRRFFGGLPSGDPNRAFAFGFLAGLLYLLPAMAAYAFVAPSSGPSAAGSAEGRSLGALCGAPCGAGVGVLVACTLLAGLLYVPALLAGAKSRFGDVFRLAAYAQAYLVVLGPAYVLTLVAPALGAGLVLLAFPLFLGMQVNAFQAYFQHRQRLTPTSATIVALTPHGVVFGLCGSLVALALYQRFAIGPGMP